uniref:Peptidoglycan-binding protein n=1 Tax=Strongyloides papillosus TaxID=174720 RepID=A0A0N5BJR6_STREA
MRSPVTKFNIVAYYREVVTLSLFVNYGYRYKYNKIFLTPSRVVIKIWSVLDSKIQLLGGSCVVWGESMPSEEVVDSQIVSVLNQLEKGNQIPGKERFTEQEKEFVILQARGVYTDKPEKLAQNNGKKFESKDGGDIKPFLEELDTAFMLDGVTDRNTKVNVLKFMTDGHGHLSIISDNIISDTFISDKTYQ